jgi:hypothetical protein
MQQWCCLISALLAADAAVNRVQHQPLAAKEVTNTLQSTAPASKQLPLPAKLWQNS